MGFIKKTMIEPMFGTGSAEAAKQGAEYQSQAALAAIAEQKAAREQGLALAQPYATAGQGGLAQLQAAMGIPIDYSGLPQAQLRPYEFFFPSMAINQPGQLPSLSPAVTGLPGLAPIQQQLPALAPLQQQLPSLSMSNMAGAPGISPGAIGQDTLFQALKQEAIKGIESSAAAKGKLFSGTTPQTIAEKVQNLALARAGDIQAQNIAARQQMAQEGQQAFGQSLAARQQYAGETGDVFARSLAARQLAGGETGDIFSRSLAAQQAAAALQGQTFGQSVAARQLYSGETQQDLQNRMAVRQALLGERGTMYSQDLAARQALLGEQLAAQERQYNQAFNLAQLGQAAASGQAANVQAAAGNIGELLTQQANALAAGKIGEAQAYGQAFNNRLNMAAMAAIMSDRRMKHDIKRIGYTDSGLPVYTFKYLNDDVVHMGVMAQEVEAVNPAAVVEQNGIKYVNYGVL